MNAPGRDSALFKKCPMCGYGWETRDAFLADPGVEIIGYQACFTELTAGYFLFNHRCAGTLAILVEALLDLHRGPIFALRKTGTPECPQHCLHKGDLSPCPAQCQCAYVRDLVQIVRGWPKRLDHRAASSGA